MNDQLISFEQHVKPLFREQDRQSMKWAFDLWSYQDVKSHGAGILQRLQNGSCPATGRGPTRRWRSSNAGSSPACRSRAFSRRLWGEMMYA